MQKNSNQPSATSENPADDRALSSLPEGKRYERTFRILLADICVEIHQNYQGIRHYCRDYLCDQEPNIILQATEADLMEENERAIQYFGYGMSSATELEKLWLYREIAERLPAFDTFLIHAAAISVDSRGYLFAGPSGTGKTTHMRLWERVFKDRLTIINDDKPLIRITEEGLRIFGSPWCGKERLNNNTSAPLAGILCLEQAKDNHIEKLTRQEAWERLLNQIYRSKDAGALKKTIELADRVISDVPVYLMKCNTDEEAAKMAYEALTNHSTAGT